MFLKIFSKTISLMLVASILLTMSVTMAFAEGEAPVISSLYADVYGAEVVFSSPLTQDIIDGISVYVYPEVENTVTITKLCDLENSPTKLVITPSTHFVPETNYVLVVNGAKTGFKLNKIAEENFDGKSVGAVDKNTVFDGIKITRDSAEIIETGDNNKALYMWRVYLASTPKDTNGDLLKNYTLTYSARLFGNNAVGRYFIHTAAQGSNIDAFNFNVNNNKQVTCEIQHNGSKETVINTSNMLSNWMNRCSVTTASEAGLKTYALLTAQGKTYNSATKYNIGFRAINGRYDAMNGNNLSFTADTNSAVFTGKTFNKAGYFYHTGGSNSSQILDDFLITTCSTFDVIDPVTVTISNIYADTHGIELTLAEGEEFEAVNANDNSLVTLLNTKTGENQSIDDVTLNGGKIYISAALEPDVIYSLKVAAGFGESAIYTNADYMKNFRVKTRLFADFNDLATGKLANSTMLNEDENLKFNNGFGEIIEDNGNKILFLNANNSKINTTGQYGNVSMSYDAKLFGGYYHRMFVRSSASLNTYFEPNASNVKRKIDNVSTTNGNYISGTTYLTSNSYSNYSTTTCFADSGLSASNLTKVNVRAVGDEFTLTREGEVVMKLTDENMPDSGYFGCFVSADKYAVLIDNLRITSFEQLDDASITFVGGINTGEITKEQLAAASAVSGYVKVANLSSSLNNSCTVLVIAYGNDNSMTKAFISDPISPSFGTPVTVPYSFTGLSDTKSIKAFVIDTLSNIKPYSHRLEF